MRYFEKQSKIIPEGGKYVVYSEEGKKFGEYDSLEKAHKRLQQMEMFKHMNKTAGVQSKVYKMLHPRILKTQLSESSQAYFSNAHKLLNNLFETASLDPLITKKVLADFPKPKISVKDRGFQHMAVENKIQQINKLL